MTDEETVEQTDDEQVEEDGETDVDATSEAPEQLPDDHPLVRTLETLKSEKKTLQQKLKEYEDAQKTEQQRLQEQLEELKPTAQEAAKLRVALRKGLNEVQARRLVGDTEEELEADADALLQAFNASSSDRSDQSRRPKETLRAGATGGSEPERDPKEIAHQILNRRI